MDVVVDGHLMMRQEKYREASLFFIVILTLSEVEWRRTPVFLFSPLLVFKSVSSGKSVESLHTRYHKISPVSREKCSGRRKIFAVGDPKFLFFTAYGATYFF
jgi:hypothetical protein